MDKTSLKQRIPYPLKKYFLSPLKIVVDDVIRFIQLAIFSIMRAYRKSNRVRKGIPVFPTSYNFVILCIKNTTYADLAIININSLHYYNPTHHITVQCDTKCYSYLVERINMFDYPTKVTLEQVADVTDKGWQFFKVEAIINAAQNDRILFDADTFWHEDITIDLDKITLLVQNGTMQDKPEEKVVIESVFHKPEWLSFIHHVAAFVSIPKKLMTPELADDMRKFNQMVWDSDLSFVPENKSYEIKRLSEELAVNLSTQLHYPKDMVVTLKEVDGTKNRTKMESLYYGCKNRITE